MPEALIVLLSVTSLIVIGPLQDALASAPLLLFLGSFTLFIVPGALVTHLLLSRHLPGMAGVPVAFALSAGIFGFPAVPALVMHWSLEVYLWIGGGILACFLILAVLRSYHWRLPVQRKADSATAEFSVYLLWILFLGLAGVLAYASTVIVRSPDADVWEYLRYIQGFLDRGLNVSTPGSGGETGDFSRMIVNGWAVEQAALSRISGVDPVELVLEYLSPALVIVALLAFYALVRTLFENATAALFSSTLYALFFLIYLDSSPLSPGGEFVWRIAEDKYVARFVFLPVALSLAVLVLRERNLRYLALFTFICCSVVTVHPMGLMIIGISMTGFGLIYLAVNWRSRRAWIAFSSLGAAMLSIGVPPAVYLLVTGSPLLSKLEATESTESASLVLGEKYSNRLLELGNGSYIMHPSLLLEPVILGAYLLGVPFLLWRLRGSLTAQLLLGVLLLVPVLLYIPPVTTFVATFIGPWNLWRLAWPLPLAALLLLSWISGKILGYATFNLSKIRALRRAVPFLPLIFVSLLTIGAVPSFANGFRAADGVSEIMQDRTDCLDPTFRWMQTFINTPAVVMAADSDNLCIKAHAARATTITNGRALAAFGLKLSSTEEVELSQQVVDMGEFFSASTVNEEMIRMIQNYGASYVLLSASSPLNEQLEHLQGFTRMDNPGERYRFYQVDREKLEMTPVIKANSYLHNKDWASAIAGYANALRGDEDERFLAYLGLGQAYMQEQQFTEAINSYQEAVALKPEDSAPYPLLAEAYAKAGNIRQAHAALEQAVTLDSRDAKLRFALGEFLLIIGDQGGTLEQYQTVTEMFPDVPEYHIELGRVLNQTKDFEAADKEFERAISLNPLSADLHADIGGKVYIPTGQFEKAATYYERALELKPDRPLYTFELGYVYSRLSTTNGKREETYFERAEEKLGRVMELEPPPGETDLRGAAQLELGELYSQWDQPEKAKAAYEQALEIDPDSPARERLKELTAG